MNTTLDIRRYGSLSQLTPDDPVRQIADRILSICCGDVRRKSQAGVVSLPSERELSKRLSVTRHAVRTALDHLEDAGDVLRVAGCATLVVPQGQSTNDTTAAVDVVRCINFVQSPALKDWTLQDLLHKYLAGYTEMLDRYDFKTRHLFWDDERQDYNRMLWNRAPWTRQACILVNRCQPTLLRWLSEHAVPFVVQFYRSYESHDLPPHHKVYVNKTGGAYKAAAHLLEMGHKRIGFIGRVSGADPNKSPAAPAYEGYFAALRCAGLTPAPHDLLRLRVELPELAVDACKAFLQRPNRPTAMMTANSAMMQGMLQAANALGLRVPEDLSIVGFGATDDTNIDRFTHVQLPQRELAYASVELLMEAIQHRTMDRQTRILECGLHVGTTSGRCER